MSYTLDVYHRRSTPSPSFLDFALYVTFFPQLVAGPIVRATDLIHQFHEEQKPSGAELSWGLGLMSWGMFQKIVLADTLLGGAADTVFGSAAAPPMWMMAGSVHWVDAWLGAMAFGGQIFFDFAGYSTTAIGAALCLGFHVPENFRFPYASASPISGGAGTCLCRRGYVIISTFLWAAIASDPLGPISI
jgi:alginate O-acetyltransferase complex protein AlgI